MANFVDGKNPIRNVLGLKDFRLLLTGSATSLLGDQLVLIATPWLVLQLTGDPLVLGIILALEGIPRALFMLVGGAIADRFSPRIIMFISDIIRLIITFLMAAAVFSGTIQIWMLYAFALCFGLVAGFAVPAQGSIVPMIVEEKNLEAGNSLSMGITQIASFIGPTVAGIVIGAYSKSLTGIGIAFGVDSATFALSALCLWNIKSGSIKKDAIEKDNLWKSIGEAVKYLWNDPIMKSMFFVVSSINILFVGPFFVGIPVLASTRLAEGALAFGILISSASLGNLTGFILAGALPKPVGGIMKTILISVLFGFGCFMILIGYLNSTLIDAILLAVLGIGNGYIAIIFFTWIQKRIPKEMLGRIMSILIFANTGLIPVSQAISGAVSKWNITMLFVIAGSLIMLVAVSAALKPETKMFSDSLVGNKES